MQRPFEMETHEIREAISNILMEYLGALNPIWEKFNPNDVNSDAPSDLLIDALTNLVLKARKPRMVR